MSSLLDWGSHSFSNNLKISSSGVRRNQVQQAGQRAEDERDRVSPTTAGEDQSGGGNSHLLWKGKQLVICKTKFEVYGAIVK